MKRPRISLARLMIRTGSVLQSLALMVMRPKDLVKFSRHSYTSPENIAGWSKASFLSEGLTSIELKLLRNCPVCSGRLLLLGVGGGREAIPLGRKGFQVTGVDFVEEMIEKTQANAALHGVHIDGLVQEISQIDVPPSSFDIVWFSPRMYSMIPTRVRRVAMLKRFAKTLRPGGVIICQFHWQNHQRLSSNRLKLYRAVALFTQGYRQLEPGDMLWSHREFLHAFSGESALYSEFLEGGFDALFTEVSSGSSWGGAVLQKKSEML